MLWCGVLPGGPAAVSLRPEPPGSSPEHGQAQQVVQAAEDGLYARGAGEVEERLSPAWQEVGSRK